MRARRSRGVGSTGRRVLWVVAAIFGAAQFLWFAALAIWPDAGGIEGALVRVTAGHLARVFLWQMWIGAPALVLLAIDAPGWLVRLLIATALLASGLLAGLGAFELSLLQAAAQSGPMPPRVFGEMLDLLRLFECVLGLAAALALRLAWRAEHVGPGSPPLAASARE